MRITEIQNVKSNNRCDIKGKNLKQKDKRELWHWRFVKIRQKEATILKWSRTAHGQLKTSQTSDYR